jgi:2-aminoadipate transaminase
MLPVHLQPESHIPLYIQLRDQLRALVQGGELRCGDRIPASRELAGQLGVHRTTVSNAYAELEASGLIVGHVGRGTFIAGVSESLRVTPVAPLATPNATLRWESLFADERGEESLNRLSQPAPKNAISFVMARPADEYFPIENLRSCSNAVLRRDGAQILQFGTADGYPSLKRELVGMLRGEGYELSDENLLITGGCQQALDLLNRIFVRPGDSVLLENPAYPGAAKIFSSARTRCIAVPVRTVVGPDSIPGVDVCAIEAALMQNRVKLIVLTPDFHNPTGTTLPIAERRRLLEIAARYQVPIVEDHIYARLHARGERLPSLKQLDRSNVVIQIDSFSKFAFPGLRVGWIIAPAPVIERLRHLKQSADLHTGLLSQAIFAEYMHRGLMERHLEKVRKGYSKRLATLEQALGRYMPNGTKWTRPEGGMCMWVELPAGFDASDLLIHSRERGVIFAPGRYFYFQNPQPNTLRLGFAGVSERDIMRGVAILADLLRTEMRKYQRGSRRAEGPRVALV